MKRRRLKVLHSAHDNSVSYLCIGNYDAAFTTKYLGVCIVSEIGQVSSYCNSDEKAGSYSSMEMSCWSNDNTDDILYYYSGKGGLWIRIGVALDIPFLLLLVDRCTSMDQNNCVVLTFSSNYTRVHLLVITRWASCVSCSNENGDKRRVHNPKLNNKSVNLKFIDHHCIDENLDASKIDRSNCSGLEHLLMNYGFRDEKRIQTGFSSLPDSTLPLVKYPAAFNNYSMSPSAKIEQQPLQTVVKSNERTLNGKSVFLTRDMSSSNGVMQF